MSKYKELLDRIDKRNYLTEREHREFLKELQEAIDKVEELEKENQELRVKGKELLNDFKETLEIAKKYKKVIDWLKNTFEITLDSKLRISDGSECVQSFIVYLPENTTIDEMFEIIPEVLCNGK